jgi:tryptophan-rich sensory protein
MGTMQTAPLTYLPAATRHRRRMLIAFLAFTFVAGAVGSLWSPGFSGAAAAFDASLLKPAWAPPNVVFGPVWSSLYALMAIAAWRVWREPPSRARRAGLHRYWGQLLLNVLWTPLFFGLGWLGVAAIEALALFVMVVATAHCFRRVDRIAGLMMVPYALWVGFAFALNASIWWLNR